MSDPEPDKTGGLQFDRAEFEAGAPAALSCANCSAPIASAYYETGGKTICESCRYALEAFMESRAGMGGAVKAVVAGVVAAIAGGVLYYAVLALSGYEFGLIAIVVGYLVGKAVNWGSGNRGGAFYQAVAVALTYVAIVGTYVPLIVREAGARSEQEAASQQQQPGAGGQPATQAAGEGQASPGSRGAAAGDGQEAAAGPDAGVMSAYAALGLFALFVLALPFLQGMQNIIGLLIIAFGLYQAWKMNRRVRLVFDGPFTPRRVASA